LVIVSSIEIQPASPAAGYFHCVVCQLSTPSPPTLDCPISLQDQYTLNVARQGTIIQL
jgi:hypothetical protein